MSIETERRVGNLLNSSHGNVPVNDSGIESSEVARRPKLSVKVANTISPPQSDSAKERLNVILKERQEKLKVHNYICQFSLLLNWFFVTIFLLCKFRLLYVKRQRVVDATHVICFLLAVE